MSEMVLLVPGRIIISGFPSCSGFVTYRTVTPEYCENTSKSVKFEIRGRRITVMSTSPTERLSSFSERLSSSSMSHRT